MNWLTIVLIALTPTVGMTSPLRVMIDPGHGGTDQGAVYGQAKEATITLQVAKVLEKKLKEDPRFEVSMTRSKDLNLSLGDRVKMAEKTNSDLFVSLHANASTDARARGAEFFFQNHLPPDEETLFLAAKENQNLRVPASHDEVILENDVQSILQDLKRSSKMAQSHWLTRELIRAWNPDGKKHSSSIRQAPFHVIAKTEIPSVLVELGYLSNTKEGTALQNPQNQKDMAEKIYIGLVRYHEKIKISPSNLLK